MGNVITMTTWSAWGSKIFIFDSTLSWMPLVHNQALVKKLSEQVTFKKKNLSAFIKLWGRPRLIITKQRIELDISVLQYKHTVLYYKLYFGLLEEGFEITEVNLETLTNSSNSFHPATENSHCFLRQARYLFFTGLMILRHVSAAPHTS